MKESLRFVCLFMLFCVVTGCDDGLHYAPITEMSVFEPIPKGGKHGVTKGETLYEVAWRYGLDYRALSDLNDIKPPYQIEPGQVIHLKTAQKSKTLTATQAKANIPDKINVIKKIAPSAEPNFASNKWLFPAKGKIIQPFSVLNKGINIQGTLGEPIYAVGAGKVVYAGDGLKRYGNLVILKHNSLYLTAYAHNNLLLVKEGDWVKKGQKIAEMGNTGTHRTMLHFEVRRAGKPVDPLTLLSNPEA